MALALSFGTICLWEAKLEDRTVQRMPLSPQTSAMSFNNGSADSEPHSNAIPFAREERTKYPIQICLIQADPVVVHGDLHDIRIRGSDDMQLPRTILDRFHRLDGIR